MLKGLFGYDSFSMVILKHSAQEIKCVFSTQSLVIGFDEFRPWLGSVLTYKFVIVIIKSHIILFQILEKSLSSEDLTNLYQLISVTITHEERLFFENLCLWKNYHRGKHSTCWPHIEGIIVVVVVNQQLWSFEISWGDSYVVVLSHMIKLCQSPID